MTLFAEDAGRSDDGPAKHSEPRFRYLNRSSRLDAGRIRLTLEEWFAQYPASHQADLCGRFQSDDDNHHRGAFFELFLHELLLRLRCRVQIHPDMSNGVTTRPDFLVECPDGEKFYLEAALASDESAEEAGKKRMVNVVYDTLDRMDSRNFFIGVEPSGAPTSSPPGRQMRVFLEGQLAKLDPDEVARRIERDGYGTEPRWKFESSGWKVEFFPIPKSPSARGVSGVRPLAMWFHGVHMISTWEAIRDAILDKAGRYGEPQFPYAIAVDVLAEHQDRIQVMEALFGQEQIIVTWSSSGGPSKPKSGREPNGAWTSPGGPRNTRISAVLIAENLVPSSAASAPICVYHNPWATRADRGVLRVFPQAVPNGDRMEWTGGAKSWEVLGLSASWPG